MRKFKFLVLTDHARHNRRNPVYHLLPELAQHQRAQVVDVASRSQPKNVPFFQKHQGTDLYAVEVHKGFGFDESGAQFVQASKHVNLEEYDVILMRLPRPVADSFMSFLVQAAPNAIFINHPLGIVKTSSKEYLLNFPDICPPMKLCRSVEEIEGFASNYAIVLKPLEDYGGKGLVKLEGNRAWEGLTETTTEEFLNRKRTYIMEKGYLAMKFLKNVKNGDKRIIVVGGEILGASLRVPPPDSWLANVAQGGKSLASSLTPQEELIIERITPELSKEGIWIYGADTLEDDSGQRVLSEVNTLSVGGFSNLEEQSNQPIIKTTISKIINYVDQNT